MHLSHLGILLNNNNDCEWKRPIYAATEFTSECFLRGTNNSLCLLQVTVIPVVLSENLPPGRDPQEGWMLKRTDC